MTAEAAGPNDIVVDMPAIVMDFDDDGQASLGNVPLAELSASLGAAGLEAISFPPETVAFLKNSNIQHFQVSNLPSGVLLLVNGQPIPSLVWDGSSLIATAETMDSIGVGLPMLEKLLPLITNLGVGAVLRFPVTEGAAVIPTYVVGEGTAAARSQQTQADFLAAVGTPPQVKLPVQYDADGSWRVGDLTDTEWTNLTGLPWGALRLQPDMIQSAMDANVSEVSLYTDPDGIHISINGADLPYVGWANGELIHVMDLAGQMGLWDQLSDQGMNAGEIIAMVENLLPAVQAAQANIVVTFPSDVARSN
ncbi:MAG: hypothetical protein HC802_13675 [Caldilineaceae bacterium]|nr:hypothetical protein [Caldilineaceae bacterium]